MRKNIARVIEAFAERRNAIGDSKRTCWTDGKSIFSYRMEIARHSPVSGPRVLVIQYDKAPTATTRSHVRAVSSYFHSNHLNVPDFEHCWEHDDCHDDIASACVRGAA